MSQLHSKAHIVATLLVITIFGALSFLDLPFFNTIERIIYDTEATFYTKPVQARPSHVALILIDHNTLSGGAGEPITKADLADMINILSQGKVRDIVINFQLAKNNNPTIKKILNLRERILNSKGGKKTRPVPEQVLRDLQEIQEDLDIDGRLIKRVKQAGNVILGIPVRKGYSNSRQKDSLPTWLAKALLPSRSGIPLKAEEAYPAVPSFSELYAAGAGIGHLLILEGTKLPGRTHPPFLHVGKGLLPSLPLVLAMRYLRATPSQVNITKNQLRIGSHVIPLSGGKFILFPLDKRQNLPRYSFAEILNRKKAPLELQDKIVIIGPERPIVNQPTSPISRAVYIPESIAQVTEALIGGPYIKRPPFMHYLELFALLFIGLLAGFLFPRIKQPSSPFLLILLMLMAIFIGWLLLSFFGIWFRTSHILCSLVALYLVSGAIQLTQLDKATKEAIEANRLLGLSYQKQGMMDLALERFKLCPLNNTTRDLIYELALECERQGLNRHACEAYYYILKKGNFRDTEERLTRLNSLDRFPGFDSQGARKREGPLSDSFIEQRRTVGRYQILERLGKGTMGYVYKGLDPNINRLVAIKVIRFSDEFEEELISEIRERFFREAKIAGRLSHPSIVTIYDVGEDKDLTYMAMEYLEGKDLEYYCQKDNLLPLIKVLKIVYKIAESLEYAHQNNVIHRDIKPANIMVLKNGEVKVTDFGIAKAVSMSRTKTGVILGTPNYMSPEQIMGHEVDARSDIFSLGVLFFQLLTGELPFNGENLSSLLYQITQTRHPSVRKLRPNIPKACEQIIDKALAKRPEDRFKSAKDIRRYIHLLILRLKEIKSKGMQ